MAYYEESQARLRRQRTKQAIDLAMQGQWPEAIVANESIIEDFPNDVDAYNRLGRACMELGEYARAREAYGRAIEIDSYNTIARKNLSRLSLLEEAQAGTGISSQTAEPQYFIEEIGKTGVVNLNQLAPPETLVKMVAGDKVNLRIDESSLVVENGRGEYLGQVEPKHSKRLIKLMEGGNKYSAAIISSAENMVTVIIREVYQAPEQAGRLSFPPRQMERLRPYATDKVIKQELETEEAEEIPDISSIEANYE